MRMGILLAFHGKQSHIPLCIYTIRRKHTDSAKMPREHITIFSNRPIFASKPTKIHTSCIAISIGRNSLAECTDIFVLQNCRIGCLLRQTPILRGAVDANKIAYCQPKMQTARYLPIANHQVIAGRI